ncbi:hypothetical protein OG625_17690 [Streptomyces sp. NBC_01351]|nr:hypothetical protein [Streptomyces sp. NBC_01351]
MVLSALKAFAKICLAAGKVLLAWTAIAAAILGFLFLPVLAMAFVE